jgi:hypothetical protein
VYLSLTRDLRSAASEWCTMFPHDDDEQAPAKLREIKGPRQHLTPLQQQVLAALAAGFAVYLASGPHLRRADQVFIGNGTRLARRSLEILLDRELIEEAGSQEKAIFYKLTEQGWNEVIRQHLHFAPDEIEVPLPHLVKEIREIAERYLQQYGYAPRVEMRCAKANISNWQQIVAYDETHDLLALSDPLSEGDLEWVSPLFISFIGGYGKLRLRPEPGGSRPRHE